MAHNLELSVVAEGIETHPPQLKFIKDNGCDYFQGGYYVSKPVEMKAFTELLKTKQYYVTCLQMKETTTYSFNAVLIV